MDSNVSESIFILEVEDRLETVQIASEIANSYCLDSTAKETAAK
jgi:hypothetical protein